MTLLSDLHGQHGRLALRGGDLLVCAGDVLRRSQQTPEFCHAFCAWLDAQPFAVKVFVGGNNDPAFEGAMHAISAQYRSLVYLENESREVAVGGLTLRVFGSPMYKKPGLVQHGFEYSEQRRADICAAIQPGTDLVVTHGPPFGVLDAHHHQHHGCELLRRRIAEVAPKLCVFGHVHPARGTCREGPTWFVNAATVQEASHGGFAQAPLLVTSAEWTPAENRLERVEVVLVPPAE